jgi:DNA-binding NtrC family response regulator
MKILVVDSHESFLNVMRDCLCKADDVHTLSDCDAALMIYKRNPAAYDLVITGRSVDALGAGELVKAIKSINGKQRVALMTFTMPTDEQKAAFTKANIEVWDKGEHPSVLRKLLHSDPTALPLP